MRKYTPFLIWWLIFSLLGLGVAVLFLFGLVSQINAGDVTKISFLIIFILLLFSVLTGHKTYLACKPDANFPLIEHKTEIGWFVSDILLTLGMIGTVIGFIYMLGTSFDSVSAGDTATMKQALAQMASGMSTALYTTAAGLIASLILKLQLVNLSQHLDSHG